MPKRNGKRKKTAADKGLGIWVQIDQLSTANNLFKSVPPGDAPVCLIESTPPLQEVPFHKKRLVLVLSLIRHFVEDLKKKGYEVYHYPLGPGKNGSLCEEGEEACLRDFVEKTGIRRLRVMESTEYDANAFLDTLEARLLVSIERVPDDHFLVHRTDFLRWFDSTEDHSVEAFYRQRRRETGILMEGGQPLGGRWNYDSDNRVPPTGNMPIPPLPVFEPDEITREVIRLVEDRFSSHVGTASDFSLPVTPREVEIWFRDFLEKRLRLFGMYQDAMVKKSPAMYHAFLSPYLNHGLIHPEPILDEVSRAYEEGEIPINSAEGFIRQILAWREYVHGLYWRKMPEYREENFFGCDREMPSLMRDGETHLKCLRYVLEQIREEGYAHHIQRLMIVGNFALLVGVEPKTLTRWFREMFIDSAEWATIPNVMGVALFADGGSLGSKPYAASAHYINKMSDYCKGCHYKGKKRLGEKACPLNYLYWNFVARNQELLRKKPRMQNAIQMYRLKPEAERELIASSAEKFLKQIEDQGTDIPKRKK